MGSLMLMALMFLISAGGWYGAFGAGLPTWPAALLAALGGFTAVVGIDFAEDASVAFRQPSPKRDRENRLALIGLFVVVVGFLGVCGVAAWGIWKFFDSANGEIIVSVIVGSVAAIGVTIARIVAQWFSSKKDREAERTRLKAEAYDAFIVEAFEFFQSTKHPEGTTNVRKFQRTIERLMIWGSDEVVREVATFKRISSDKMDDKVKGTLLIAQLEIIIRCIRMDIGHSNKGVDQLTILRLFINDVDEQADLFAAANDAVRSGGIFHAKGTEPEPSATIPV